MMTLSRSLAQLYIYFADPWYMNLFSKTFRRPYHVRTIQSVIHSKYTRIEEGEFRFNELVVHLEKHNLPKVVTISEDGTRVIKKVEYDPSTNRCVGFVLPRTANGCVETNKFEAISFEAMEIMLRNNSIAKYAYTYVAQPLQDKAPPFRLSCFGTDNKFTSADILNRWEFILAELKKRNIMVVNFAADGDSRLLKSMITHLQ